MKNLYISAAEYDYHTLLKVAEMAGLAGIVGFHEAGDATWSASRTGKIRTP